MVRRGDNHTPAQGPDTPNRLYGGYMKVIKRITIIVTHPANMISGESVDKLVASTDWQTLLEIYDPFQGKQQCRR